MSKEIDQLLTKSGTAINNSLQNTKLQPLLAEFGYTAEKLTEGKALLDTATSLNITQAKETGEKVQATATLDEKRELANREYIKYVKIARIAFTDEPGIWKSLGLAGERKGSISGWISQARQFYSNLMANTDWMTKMNTYGITIEKLQAGEELLQEVEEAQNQQKTEMGEAQEATRLRDEAADILQDWYSDFIAIARIALEDNPQYLEMLGIVKK
ncbi:hypothetical protein [Draconibacterium sediminis]|uniref:hypothetical protein n=1 Tax=Draconibacterium sediminis TaxID=1544798 RepID=UPI0005D35075|nr:hypothetical protein [Draconibacterium sediminis]